jgi:hypothetical protein
MIPERWMRRKVTEDERVARLGVVLGAVGQPEEPPRVRVPSVSLEVRGLRSGIRLHRAPLAVEHVLALGDQLASERQAGLVERIRGHRSIVTVAGVALPDALTPCRTR